MRALFSLGSVLERQKKFDEAEKAFRKALVLSPDSAITLNYLGYMNADRNVEGGAKRLPSSRRRSRTIPRTAPTSTASPGPFTGSAGTARPKPRSARPYQTQEKNAVVIAHLGLILAAKGDDAEALKYLRLALEGEDEDGELDRALVEKKIQALSRAAQKKP